MSLFSSQQSRGLSNYPLPSPQSRSLGYGLLIAGLVLATLIFGAAIPLFGLLIPAFIAITLLSIAILALSPVTIVWIMLVLVLLVVGQFTFFLGIQKAAWLPYLLLALIFVKWLMASFAQRPPQKSRPTLSMTAFILFLFIALFFLSAKANRTDISSMAVAAKNYIFPWFLTGLVAWGIDQPEKIRRIWKFLLAVVFVQLPLAIPQHFYFAKLRGENGLDAVVGSFGGSIYSGGASGTMAIYLVFSIVLAAALYWRKVIGGRFLIFVIGFALSTIALAEVKVFFLALPLALMLLFRKALLANFGKTLAYGTAGLLLLGLLVVAYQQTTSGRLAKANSLDGYIQHTLSAESDPYMFNPVTRELSRMGAILMWLRYNSASDPYFYIGQGPAASRQSQTLGVGIAARKYPFTLTTSSASTLLWDEGAIGYLLLIGLLLSSGLTAIRLAPKASPTERAALESIGAILLLSIPLSLYNRDAIDSPTMQTLIAFWVGYVLLCRRHILSGAPTTTPGSQTALQAL